MYLILKFALSAAVIVAVSEIAKRSSPMAALIASLPLTSVLAMIWLYAETGDSARVAQLSSGIFWLVLPSLALFLVLPVLLRAGMGFYLSLTLAGLVTISAYGLMTLLLRQAGITL
jgi:hypothetical protein